MPAYLEHLGRRLRRAGGEVVERSYGSLDEVVGAAPVVVNCSGLGARELVPDPQLTPCRGRLVVVANPGIDTFFCDDTPDAADLVYIFPHADTVVLGGTADRGATELTADPSAGRAILDRCAEVEPLLRDAPVLAERVGVRPLRSEVRLAEERTARGRLLHNYGHGGAGVTLSWGCAREVTRLVVERN
jgi:D-amino-acid oxidase